MANGNDFSLTVGDIRKAINGLPDDMPVFYQRIEDFYFDQHNWKTVGASWEEPGQFTNYIRAETCHYHPDINSFVINGHY